MVRGDAQAPRMFKAPYKSEKHTQLQPGPSLSMPDGTNKLLCVELCRSTKTTKMK